MEERFDFFMKHSRADSLVDECVKRFPRCSGPAFVAYFASFFVRSLVKSDLEFPEGSGVADF